MGRNKTLGRCTLREFGIRCTARATRRGWCPHHYSKWYDKNKNWRCQWPGCRQFKFDGGRSMARKGKKLFFCRLHEVEHLRPTPEIEDMNFRRLGGSIKDINGCWVWIGGVQGKYGAFVPEGANQVSWMAHRVMWDLLMGGHRPRYELDHDFCRNPPCVNPSHLEPVLRSENERRKRKPKRSMNWSAAEDPKVRIFAERFGLSIPVRPELSSNPFAKKGANHHRGA